MSKRQGLSARLRLPRAFAVLCAVVGLCLHGGLAQAAGSSPAALSVGLNTLILPTPNQPPVIGGSPPASVTAGQAYGFTPTASDPEGQPLTFGIVNKPDWVVFSGTNGRISGTPGASHVGTYSGIVISVSDGRTSASLGPFSITVVAAANRPPVIGGTPPASVTAGQAYGFTPTASDPDGQALAFSIANKPAWASFSGTTGRLAGTPTALQVGTYSNIVISVSDGQASDSIGPFSITVVAANLPPVISGTPGTSVQAGQIYLFTPVASDPEGQPLTFSIVNKPVWANFSPTTGRMYGFPGLSHAGTYAGIRISVSDGQSTASLPVFSITVVGTRRATVSWTPPTTFENGDPLTNLAGFRIHYGVSTDALTNTVEIPSPLITSAAIENLAAGTWYFAVTAYTTTGAASDLSAIRSKTVN